MKIFIADNVPNKADAQRVQQALQAATQHSGLLTAVGERCWEVAAYLVPCPHNVDLLIQFVLRDSEAEIDQALVGADEQGSPLPIDEVLGPGLSNLKASLYMLLAENVAMAATLHADQTTSVKIQ